MPNKTKPDATEEIEKPPLCETASIIYSFMYNEGEGMTRDGWIEELAKRLRKWEEGKRQEFKEEKIKIMEIAFNTGWTERHLSTGDNTHPETRLRAWLRIKSDLIDVLNNTKPKDNE